MENFCDLSGQTALVTGASSGIGAATARLLASRGANVTLAARRLERLEQLASELDPSGKKVLPQECDVTVKAQIDKTVEATVAKFGRLDILVNNAGVVSMKSFTELSEEDWDFVLNVNLKGQFLVAQAAVLKMKKNSYGRIVNISSVAAGQQGFGAAGAAHYTASKGGVAALTEAMAVELAPDGILVNALAPGLIETEMTDPMLADEKTKEAYLAPVPLKRAGKAEEMANLIAFLVSKENSYMTGSYVVADGGWLAT